jgi:hypothetical protein
MIKHIFFVSVLLFMVDSLMAKHLVSGVVIGFPKDIDKIYFFPGTFNSFEDVLKDSSIGFPIINSSIYEDMLDGIYIKKKIQIINNSDTIDTKISFLQVEIDTSFYSGIESRLMLKDATNNYSTFDINLLYLNRIFTLHSTFNTYIYIDNLICSKTRYQRKLIKRIAKFSKMGTMFNWRRSIE